MSPLTGMVGYGGGGTGLTFNSISGPAWFGDRGLYGHKSGTYHIEYFNIAATGNSSDFGDFTAHTGSSRVGLAGSGLGIWCGGYQSDAEQNWISYSTVKTLGNTTDFGDLTYNTRNGGGCSDGTRAIMSGGINETTGNSDYVEPTINYFELPTPGNASDFGDMLYGRMYHGVVNNETRAVFYGGQKIRGDQSDPGKYSDYVTIQTTGNATSFGYCIPYTEGGGGYNSRRNVQQACSDQGRGIFAGGQRIGWSNSWNADEIDYITIDTLGNGADFGDLTQGRLQPAFGNSSNKTRGVFCGGELSNSSTVNTMDYITFDSTGNATDHGDLLEASQSGAACAN